MSPDGSDQHRPGHHPARPVRVQADAYVVSHTESALSEVEHAVTVVQTPSLKNFTVTTSAHGRTTLPITQSAYYYGRDERRITYSARDEQLIIYSGPDQARITSPGLIGTDWGYTVTPLRTVTLSVDYQGRVWSQVARSGPPRGVAFKAPTCSSVPTIVTEGNPAHWAVALRKALDCDQYTSAGSKPFLGTHLIKLIPVHPGREAVTLWVDPSSFLPVWVAVEARPRLGAPLRVLRYQSVQWLTPTAANVAKLAVPIPQGFAHVAPSLGSQPRLSVPALIWPVNACHCSGASGSTGPLGSLESRTPTTWRGLSFVTAATSTQLPCCELRLHLRHEAPEKSIARHPHFLHLPGQEGSPSKCCIRSRDSSGPSARARRWSNSSAYAPTSDRSSR